MQVHMPLCVHQWRPEVEAGCPHLSLSDLLYACLFVCLLETGSLTEPGTQLIQPDLPASP